jgi:hypothetical protein
MSRVGQSDLDRLQRLGQRVVDDLDGDDPADLPGLERQGARRKIEIDAIGQRRAARDLVVHIDRDVCGLAEPDFDFDQRQILPRV